MLPIDEQTNDLFSAANVDTRVRALMRDLLESTNRLGLSMSVADIKNLKTARAAALGTVQAIFDRMIEQTEDRRKNLLTMEKIKVISLGEDCFSRSLCTHWGLKPNAKLGERSHPFDLAVHPVNVISYMIETDFADYLDLANLRFAEKERIVFNQKCDIYFNHEVGPEYAENDFARFREIYTRRIANFYNDIHEAGTVAFLCHVEQPSEYAHGEIERLWQVLSSKWQDKRIYFIAINTWPHGAEIIRFPRRASGGEGFHLIDVNNPFPNYVWHIPDHCFTPEGYAFEREVIRRIKLCLDNQNTDQSLGQEYALAP